MNVKTVKKYIDILQRMGYNTLMLYTEDTYEVDNQPYFGYLRGRYTKAEMKELDAYALEHGIEMIPCIQTLAHFDALVRWNEYKPYVDATNILLCGDDRTYQLIDDMFDTMYEYNGVGLAAPQVGVPLRIFVYSYEDDEGAPWRGVVIDPELCKGCTKCARNCPVGAITGTPRNPHEIDQSKCIKCGACLTNCKFNAVREEA
jgi:NAD-dependent dihydropyrimidine dehydrogenase PreA subunit